MAKFWYPPALICAGTEPTSAESDNSAGKATSTSPMSGTANPSLSEAKSAAGVAGAVAPNKDITTGKNTKATRDGVTILLQRSTASVRCTTPKQLPCKSSVAKSSHPPRPPISEEARRRLKVYAAKKMRPLAVQAKEREERKAAAEAAEAKAIPPFVAGHFSTRFITNLPSRQENRLIRFSGRGAQVASDLWAFKELEQNPHFTVIRALGIEELLGQPDGKDIERMAKVAVERNLKDLSGLTMVFQNHHAPRANIESDNRRFEIAVQLERWQISVDTPFRVVEELVIVNEGFLEADTAARARLTVSRKALLATSDNSSLALHFFGTRGPDVVYSYVSSDNLTRLATISFGADNRISCGLINEVVRLHPHAQECIRGAAGSTDELQIDAAIGGVEAIVSTRGETDGSSESSEEPNEVGKRPMVDGDESLESEKRIKLELDADDDADDEVDDDDAQSDAEKDYIEENLDSNGVPVRYDAWFGKKKHTPDDEALHQLQQLLATKLWPALPYTLRNRYRIEVRDSATKAARLFFA
ncbi:hypothetical protein IAT38_004828 [Cryptococcus sp. DSM 104549]